MGFSIAMFEYRRVSEVGRVFIVIVASILLGWGSGFAQMFVAPAETPAFSCFMFGDKSLLLAPFLLGMNIHFLPIKTKVLLIGLSHAHSGTCLRLG